MARGLSSRPRDHRGVAQGEARDLPRMAVPPTPAHVPKPGNQPRKRSCPILQPAEDLWVLGELLTPVILMMEPEDPEAVILQGRLLVVVAALALGEVMRGTVNVDGQRLVLVEE